MISVFYFQPLAAFTHLLTSLDNWNCQYCHENRKYSFLVYYKGLDKYLNIYTKRSYFFFFSPVDGRLLNEISILRLLLRTSNKEL